MIAEVVSVGTELLLGATIDTNAARLGEVFAECGISCQQRQTVGDNLGRLTEALWLALSRSDIVVTIGGLGPTQDDLTRDGIAAALGSPLLLDPDLERTVREIFEKRGLRWVDSNLRQCHRPACGVGIANPHGTAPGLWCEKDGKILIAMPGPPREFGPMLMGPVREGLARLGGGGVIHSRTLRVTGIGESRIEELVRDLIDDEQPTVAPYAKTGEVHLRVTAKAPSISEAEVILAPVVAEIHQRLGWHCYGEDATSLEAAVIEALGDRRLAVAESLTGGGVMSRLTGVPGASRVLAGGLVAYTNAIKVAQLGVDPGVLAEESAVSETVARQMAEGIRNRLGVDFGLATTGVAGPGPDDRGNPEGLTYLALSGPTGTTVEQHQFGMGREINRARATQAALTFLYRSLKNTS